MLSNNWLFCNGELEVVRITPDLYDQTVELFKSSFLKYENISIAANLSGSQQTINEMEMLIREALKDGISLATRTTSTKEVVGLNINKILNPSTNCTLDNVFAKFTSANMKCVGDYLHRMETTFDLHKEWNLDCVMEILFLSINPEYGRKGICFTLAQHAMKLAQSLNESSYSEDELQKLPAHIRHEVPKAVCSVFTSLFSQKIGDKLGMKAVNKISHAEFEFEGKKFSEKIDKIHEFSTFAAIRL